ncbi:MAG: Tol-Pal system beta propeller repeat protein TolB [Thiotrichales bacterium]|nr:Tol-Pal system beta propeller repeat protein TolB [Thiotrichales bacterium]MBT3854310.1 Tol-Pal system beta propeller repeat protein TolB [Thiotrichales bacterium]MBT5983659.1 Tol-Pal system beta propeller repeat protein TolB [Thiotrichales bacterium]MBT6771252.1 Tol-Pal system beta propeller repeat protein TolB [Thiotrichales bacterium]MBT7438874.1 Tol-Pal system beta propeller repeat protein TolB [Thiotrichales bacterium]
MKIIKFLISLSIFISLSANALLEVNIIKSKEAAFPIVIAPFEIVGDSNNVDISKIIRDNLNRSGQFNALSTEALITNQIDFSFWKEHKKDAVVFGKIEQVSSKVYNVYIYIYDVFSEKSLYQKKIRVHNSGFRRIAHFLSDKIYYVLLGQKGSFDTRLSYVTVIENKNGGRTYKLQISDSDGYNPQTVVRSSNPILSPAWSKDQKKLAYVSFKNNRSEVFVMTPFLKTIPIKLPKFDGIASSPTWHPDGESIALTLSKNGNKDIYLYDFKSKPIPLTTNIAIDTEASFSPDGSKIAFTSNRTGQVQVYIKNLKSGKISRATFEGRYNAKPVFSPDGKDLALIHRVGKDYRLALLDIASRDLTVMTQNKSDESPYFSPNGGMIIYSTNRDNKGILSIISLHNNQTVELMQKEGEVREPSWSNYSN